MMRFALRYLPKCACLCLVLIARSRCTGADVTVTDRMGLFGILDTATGNFTQTGTTIGASLQSITSTGTGAIYAMDDVRNLRRVYDDGTSDIIGNSGNGILGVAERPSDGQLFGVSFNNDHASLYTINQINGASTLIHSMDVGTNWYNVAFDDANTMYFVNAPGEGQNSKLYTVDLISGSTTLLGPVGTAGLTMNVDSMVFKNGVLYGFLDDQNATAGLADHIITINRTTGAGTDLLSYATNNLRSVFGAASVVVQFPVTADYNRNGVVDAADYVLWRNTLGQSLTAGTGADGDSNGHITVADYDIWRAHFGQSAGNGSGKSSFASVPEPTGLALIFIAAFGLVSLRPGHNIIHLRKP